MTPVIFHIDVNSAYLIWIAVEQLKRWCRNRFAQDPVDHRWRSEIPSWGCPRKVNPAKKIWHPHRGRFANAFRKCPNLVIEPPVVRSTGKKPDADGLSSDIYERNKQGQCE